MFCLIVIVYGWSDDLKLFCCFVEQLEVWFGSVLMQICFVDWIFLQDDVIYVDFVVVLDCVWIVQGLLWVLCMVDVVVYSIGVLVLCDWLICYFDFVSVLVKCFLMFVLVNFGLLLVYKGCFFIGCVLKGWNCFVGQIGIQVLKGLELGLLYFW